MFKQAVNGRPLEDMLGRRVENGKANHVIFLVYHKAIWQIPNLFVFCLAYKGL
jgi:hypothetical protein